MPAIREDYVAQAEAAIKALKTQDRQGRDKFDLTTSQLRNLLSLTAQIFDEAEAVQGDEIPQALQDKVQYLRVRFIYQAGREPAVKKLLQQAKLLEALAEIGDSRDELIRFCRYMEALAAYKKFLDPQDK
jgi:CRISPR-associated protein Csm2